MWACQHGHEACARLLLDHGADANHADSYGATALMRARQDGHEALAELLGGRSALLEQLQIGDGMCCAVTFCTAALADVVTQHGQVFYELTLTRVGPSPQIGWATEGFAPDDGNGVGDDDLSWGADGARGRLWHGGDQEWPVRWADGDVVGCAADLDQGQIWFGLNGAWTLAFEGCHWAEGLFPAFAGCGMTFAVNQSPLFEGPAPGFRSLAPAAPPRLLAGKDFVSR